MISPYTKPGTKIVCVDAENDDRFVRGFVGIGDMDGLTENAVYTVLRIDRCHYTASGFLVVLAEITRAYPSFRNIYGFDLHRFRYLDLPSCLTELLDTVPTRSPSELETAR